MQTLRQTSYYPVLNYMSGKTFNFASASHAQEFCKQFLTYVTKEEYSEGRIYMYDSVEEAIEGENIWQLS